MSILWRRGSGTVAEVREEMVDELAYTSVLWVLQTLSEKGAVRHEQEGRAYRYFPTVPPEEAGDNALARLMDKVFHGSAEMLLARLVAEQDLSESELRRMRELLDRRLEAPSRREADRIAPEPERPEDRSRGPTSRTGNGSRGGEEFVGPIDETGDQVASEGLQ